MDNYQEIFEYNRKWAAGKKATEEDFFLKLAGDQDPGYLYIGCVDSRVTPEILMGARPGEVLVHRNIANLVIPSDTNTMSVINFSLSRLQVRHIVVCGHYQCGGVQEAMQKGMDDSLDPWLNHLREVIRMHRDELFAIDDEMQRHNRLAEINVLEQCKTVFKLPVVQESLKKNGNPKIHGWVYNMNTGELIDLDFRP